MSVFKRFALPLWVVVVVSEIPVALLQREGVLFYAVSCSYNYSRGRACASERAAEKLRCSGDACRMACPSSIKVPEMRRIKIFPELM